VPKIACRETMFDGVSLIGTVAHGSVAIRVTCLVFFGPFEA
jgi:hypothetical protein